MRSSYLCSPCQKILGINCFNPGQHSLVCPQLTLHPAIASDRSSCIGMVPNWCACHLGPWVLTQCHLATHSALIKTTRNALYIHIHMYIYMYIYNYIYIYIQNICIKKSWKPCCFDSKEKDHAHHYSSMAPCPW